LNQLLDQGCLAGRYTVRVRQLTEVAIRP